MYQPVVLEFFNIGGSEMTLIVVVILFLFGGKKLPELARGLGRGIREFKDASEGVKREIHRNINLETEDLAVDSYDNDAPRQQQYQNFHPHLVKKEETTTGIPQSEAGNITINS